MSRAAIPVPGLLWGDYPERRPTPRPSQPWVERATTVLRGAGDRLRDGAVALLRRRDHAWLAQLHAAQCACEADVALGGEDPAVQALRLALLRHGLTPDMTLRTLALVATVAHRHLGVRPFDTQLLGARVVLDNCLAEMATGEGKTLTVALAAAAAALTGMPVHVITANDYLVARDAERMAPLFAALGLRVGAVLQSDATTARRNAYACCITYVTAKELVFDYLRDGLAASLQARGATRLRDALPAALARLHGEAAPPPLLRGLCMAIVDEADAILIDEARVPLILSQPTAAEGAERQSRLALECAHGLREGLHFTLNGELMSAELSDAGRQQLQSAAEAVADGDAGLAWRNRVHREHSVCVALAALHLFQRDRHYLVRDGKVLIIDPTTGRVAEGRAWGHGLQQAVEAREGCEASPALATVAQLTYQRFFPRYVRLGGLSGTLAEARSELIEAYGLSVRRIPLRRLSRRTVAPTRLFAHHAALWDAVTERVVQLHASGRPVLVAADSVAEAQALSGRLQARKLPHAVLHARNDAEEASVVARAGQRGAITVTTNMAGRGTDIELGPGMAELGGLHVLCCQLNTSRRIDRQLAGRSARQGEPGSVETWLSLDTVLLAQSLPVGLRGGQHPGLAHLAAACPSWGVRWGVRLPQRWAERNQRLQRRRLIEHDERQERRLSFGGVPE